MSATDDLLQNAKSYAARFDAGDLPRPPARKVAIVSCMDARINLYTLLGLEDGDAHIIRNAGGLITEDEIRSLAISQSALGTEEIVVIHHTDCGIYSFTDEELRTRIEADVGHRPDWPAQSYPDLDEGVRQSLGRIRDSPFILHKESVRGFVYEVETGRLREVV
jgi:carbonic anhydrase